MPVALQPEEVVEVFVGDSLEEAMAFAVAALGPDLTVRRARKVRKGVQGLVGKDKYEVVAVPSPSLSSDALESAFDALLSQAEELEEPAATTRPRRTVSRPHPSPEVADHEPLFVEPVPVVRRTPAAQAAVEQPFYDEDDLDETPAAEVVVRSPRQPAAPAAQVATRTPERITATRTPAARTVAARTPEGRTPAADAPATRTPASRKKAAPRKKAPAPTGWSYDALAALGLPSAVLEALPAEEPGDDLAWVVALAVAMSSVMAAPAALSESNPLVVNGYGMEGVLGLLEAGARGLTPGTITVGDRTAPATATELALAVRTAVVG